jgi:hypothetical protein
MPRIIDVHRRTQISAARESQPDALGPLLAERVLAGNVPVEAVAGLLAVSRPTIYRWLYGETHPRNAEKITRIRRLLRVLEQAHDAAQLPLTGSVAQRVLATAQLVKTYRPPSRL